jgi:hypothetical protein
MLEQYFGQYGSLLGLELFGGFLVVMVFEASNKAYIQIFGVEVKKNEIQQGSYQSL